MRKNQEFHGRSRTREYRIWAGMMRRCYTPSTCIFEHYGGRGIRVCASWHNFSAFIADMGLCPPRNSIGRLDNDGDYCPENCLWQTQKEQSRNTRRNHTLTVDGVTKTISEWAELTGFPKTTIRNRISYGWLPEYAVTVKPSLRKPQYRTIVCKHQTQRPGA